MLKKFILYMLRWQISTPVIGLCYALMQDSLGLIWTAILANVIGGLVFFYPDLYIFKDKPTWVVINKINGRILQKFKTVRLARAFVDEYKTYFHSKGIDIIYTKED